jgi:superfamily I DNA/RNA helicase
MLKEQMNTKANIDKSGLLTEDVVVKTREYIEAFPYKEIKDIVSTIRVDMSDKDKVNLLAYMLKKDLGTQVYYVVFGSIDLTGEGKDVPIEDEVLERVKVYLEDYPYSEIKEILAYINAKMDVKEKLGIINYLISKQVAVFIYHMVFNSIDFSKLEQQDKKEEVSQVPQLQDKKEQQSTQVARVSKTKKATQVTPPQSKKATQVKEEVSQVEEVKEEVIQQEIIEEMIEITLPMPIRQTSK